MVYWNVKEVYFKAKKGSSSSRSSYRSTFRARNEAKVQAAAVKNIAAKYPGQEIIIEKIIVEMQYL